MILASEATADGLWLMGNTQVFKITLPGFHTDTFEAPPARREREWVRWIQSSPTALYASIADSGGVQPARELARYDFATRTWTTRELPLDFCNEFTLIGESVYLSLVVTGQDWSHRETGLAKYDWNSQKLTLLASNRRRPALNQFDDTEPYSVSGVFLGPGDKPCVTTDVGTFYIHEDAGAWPRVFDGAASDRSITSLGKTVVLNLHGEAILIDPRSPAPIPWMAAAYPFGRNSSRVEPTPWASQALWDGPPRDSATNGEYLAESLVGFHDDWFFKLVEPKHESGDYDLWCYQKGQGRKPRHVPLHFALDAATRATLLRGADQEPDEGMGYTVEHLARGFHALKVIGTQQGLCFLQNRCGFWFLPYGDIDAYLKDARN